MKPDYGRRYNSASDFYDLQGSHVMRLSAEAAVETCRLAAEHGLVVTRIEGGIWLNPGFESRLDCIWSGAYPPVDRNQAVLNNETGAKFIKSESAAHNVFIVGVAPFE